MPLEIRGLKAKALAMRANIDRLHKAYDAFNDKAPLHAADVEGIAGQIEAMGSDLSFAVNVLGNSTAQSDEKRPDEQKAPPAAPPEVGSQDPATFQQGA